MRKSTLCLSAFLLASYVNGFGQEATPKSTAKPPLPEVVQTVALTGQTADIPTTTIFTPKSSGLIRVSIYMTTTVPSPTAACLSAQLNWMDDGGPQISDALNTANFFSICQNFGFLYTGVGQSFASETLVMRVNAGTPLTYQISNVPDGMTYELFMTVERLM